MLASHTSKYIIHVAILPRCMFTLITTSIASAASPISAMHGQLHRCTAAVLQGGLVLAEASSLCVFVVSRITFSSAGACLDAPLPQFLMPVAITPCLRDTPYCTCTGLSFSQ
jgi:hypothetical protein